MSTDEQQTLEAKISLSLRHYMLLMMHKLAPPEGLVFEVEEVIAMKDDPRNHLMIYTVDGKVFMKLVMPEEAPLLAMRPGGSA